MHLFLLQSLVYVEIKVQCIYFVVNILGVGVRI